MDLCFIPFDDGLLCRILTGNKGGNMKYITRKNGIILLLTLIGETGICYLFNLMSKDGGFSFSFFSIPLFFVIFCWNKRLADDPVFQEEKKIIRRRMFYSFLVSFLFALSLVMGYQLKKDEMLLRGYSGKFIIFAASAAIAAAFLMPVNEWFAFLDRRKADMKKDSDFRDFDSKENRKHFFLSFGVLILCWMPVFLAFYPAVMAHDFHRQSQEAYKGWIWFNDHHPLMHTMLIRFAFLFGEKIGSLKVGMACYSIFQMLVCGAVFAYLCTMIARLAKRKWPMYVSLAFLSLFPVVSVMVLSVTKDTLFTAFFVLFLLIVLERKFYHGRGMRIFLDLSLVITGIFTVLYRNNAVYALALFAVFYIIWSKGERILVFLLCAVMLTGGVFAKNEIRTAMNAGTGSKVEMYSVFLMQMARVGYLYYDNTLDEYEKSLIDPYISAYAWENGGYNPYIADGIKSDVAVSTFLTWKEDVPGMLKSWFLLGLHYPNEYIDAFLLLTDGYWFIDDVSHAEVLGYGEETRLGLLYTFDATPDFIREEGLSEETKFPALFQLYKKILNGNLYYHWPVLSSLFKPSFYCWSLLICMISLAYLGKGKKQILNLLPFFYLLTILLGPVVIFRYVFPVAVAGPLLFAWLLSGREWTGDKNGWGCYES